MSKIKSVDFVKKYTMIIVLIIVTAFFAWRTGGAILLPMNVSSLISQNAYVFILATGMLLCILTGGNIDLSVGSVVCFVGAIGAMLMVNMKMNMWLAILVMFAVGTLIGAFQGFWIAYVRIPPFIVTLAGMLAFRGLSNVVLDGMTVSIKDCTTFVNLFGGGADCYIPDFFGNGSLNMTCIFAGVLAAAIYISIQIKERMDKVKKGYEVEGLITAIMKMVIITAVILAFTYRLAQHKGIPSVLIWVLIVIMVYGYITSNTTVGRYFYAVGGNEKATKLSGINTNKVYFLAYMNMGFLAALAGMVTIALASLIIGESIIGKGGMLQRVTGVILGSCLYRFIVAVALRLNVPAECLKLVSAIIVAVAIAFPYLKKQMNFYRQKRAAKAQNQIYVQEITKNDSEGGER